jgi:hypothetical protein
MHWVHSFGSPAVEGRPFGPAAGRCGPRPGAPALTDGHISPETVMGQPAAMQSSSGRNRPYGLSAERPPQPSVPEAPGGADRETGCGDEGSRSIQEGAKRGKPLGLGLV